MAVRREVLERVGPFDERLVNGGDEEELQQRWRAARPGGRIRYVAAAEVVHRRAGHDARLRSLAGPPAPGGRRRAVSTSRVASTRRCAGSSGC